jgi:hypothetical protein
LCAEAKVWTLENFLTLAGWNIKMQRISTSRDTFASKIRVCPNGSELELDTTFAAVATKVLANFWLL